MRPVDLARHHGLSTQAVRNYEDAGIIPRAHRGRTGYRDYTATHAAGLAAYLALVPAVGYSTSRRIMQAVTGGQVDEALEYVDEGHVLLARDRSTLRTVEASLAHLESAPGAATSTRAPWSIGELARHLGLDPATLRSWERAAVLTPQRDPRTGHREYLAPDVRDAELAHLLRRGGRTLGTIATVLGELRNVGTLEALARTLDGWRRDLTSRGRAQLNAAGQLATYLDAVGPICESDWVRSAHSGSVTNSTSKPSRLTR